jgi:hypothetical protein
MESINPHRVSSSMRMVFLVMSIPGVLLCLFSADFPEWKGVMLLTGIIIFFVGLYIGIESWFIRQTESFAYMKLEARLLKANSEEYPPGIVEILFFEILEDFLSPRRYLYFIWQRFFRPKPC